MTNKKLFFSLILSALMCVPFTTNAQITIGSGRAPSEWSLLDLCTNEQQKALHNARMTLLERDALNLENLSVEDQQAARGLMIFRLDAVAPGVGCLEFWNGVTWISLCEDRQCLPITSITLSHTEEIQFDYSTQISTAVTLSVEHNGTEPFTYRWFTNTSASNAGGTPIPNATGSSFTTASNLALGVHFFFVEIENCDGIVRSEVFTVRVLCPGLLIPGGAFVERTGFVTLPPASQPAHGFGNTDTAAPAITATLGAFQRSGYCLCIYYRDLINPHNEWSNNIHWNWFSAERPGYVSGNYCGNINVAYGVDAIHAHPDWRVPNIAELAQIGQLVANNPSSNNNSLIGGPVLTQAMVDAHIRDVFPGTNGFLPPGTTVSTVTPMLNLLHFDYWSSTQGTADAGHSGRWSWGYTHRRALVLNDSGNQQSRIRCVRTVRNR